MNNKMTEKETANLLADCLDRFEKNGESIQQAAAMYPEFTEELIALLQTCQAVERSEKVLPPSDFKSVARTRLINRISALEKTSKPSPVTKPGSLRHIWQNNNGTRRFAMRWLLVIGLIVSMIGGGGGAAFASADALPGDMLYPLKTSLQDIKLTFSSDINDIDLLLGHIAENIQEMQQLAVQERYSDILIGLGQYEENLQAMTQTRTRLSYDDAGSEESLNTRIQEQLQTHLTTLEQLMLQTRDQIRLQDQLQDAIQLTETGAAYGPNEGGPPEEPGTPNGVRPGEPQGPQSDPGKPDDTGSGSGQGNQGEDNPGKGPGPADPGTDGQNQNSYGDGDGICNCVEEDLYCVMGEVQDASGAVANAVCTCEQTEATCGEGGYQNQPGPGEGSSGSGQGGKP